LVGLISIAKSFVIDPFSTVAIQTFSKDLLKSINFWFESNFPRCANPLDQANIEAIGLVEVYFPC